MTTEENTNKRGQAKAMLLAHELASALAAEIADDAEQVKEVAEEAHRRIKDAAYSHAYIVAYDAFLRDALLERAMTDFKIDVEKVKKEVNEWLPGLINHGAIGILSGLMRAKLSAIADLDHSLDGTGQREGESIGQGEVTLHSHPNKQSPVLTTEPNSGEVH